MFNLKQELKLYSCEKYNFLLETTQQYRTDGKFYYIPSTLYVKEITETRYGRQETSTQLVIQPDGLSTDKFYRVLELVNIPLYHITSIATLIGWLQRYPKLNLESLSEGAAVDFQLNKELVYKGLETTNPAAYMQRLCLAADSRLAYLIGKAGGTGYYGRRRNINASDRENYLLRLWVLYGLDVAAKASRKTLDTVVDGVQLKDFGITNCETMETVLEFIDVYIRAAIADTQTDGTLNVYVLANSVKKLDSMLKAAGGETIQRRLPRSPLLRALYNEVYSK